MVSTLGHPGGAGSSLSRCQHIKSPRQSAAVLQSPLQSPNRTFLVGWGDTVGSAEGANEGVLLGLALGRFVGLLVGLALGLLLGELLGLLDGF